MGTCPSKPGKLNGSNVDNFVMANQGTPAKPKNIDSQPKENKNPKPGKLNGSNVDNLVMADQGTPAIPDKNVQYNKNLKVVSTSAEPKNKNVQYNKNLQIDDSQPKENENPKPVEKEEKVQNGPTMVGGKRKHRKTQRKLKKRRSSRK